jgi:hypothetical protein
MPLVGSPAAVASTGTTVRSILRGRIQAHAPSMTLKYTTQRCDGGERNPKALQERSIVGPGARWVALASLIARLGLAAKGAREPEGVRRRGPIRR